MARRSLGCLCLVIILMIAFAGCGVKGPPVPRSKLIPKKVTDLRARTLNNGIELSFTVPQYEEPGRMVEEVQLYYGYLPLTGDPECPPCPPRLKRYITLSLLGADNKLLQGGSFSYVDNNAPLNKDAFYQVVLIDASGRESKPSNMAHSPRVTPPSKPTGLVVTPGDGVVSLAWNGITVPKTALEKDGLQGWVVYRRNGDVEKLLVGRPLRAPELEDRTVENGVTYYYRVAAVHAYNKVKVEGRATDWAQGTPRDAQVPSTPQDLLGAASSEGVNLRFSPIPEQDLAGYLIFRSTKTEGPWILIGGGPIRENVYTDTEVTPGTTYYYKVQAVDEAGNKSAMSEVIQVRF